MREVAWVVFDEIHYMRDSGIFCCVEMCVPCIFLKDCIGNFEHLLKFALIFNVARVLVS